LSGIVLFFSSLNKFKKKKEKKKKEKKKRKKKKRKKKKGKKKKKMNDTLTIDKKDIFVITSVIDTGNLPWSYCPQRSLFSPEERVTQTIKTIESIRKYAENNISLPVNYITMDYNRPRSHSKSRIRILLCTLNNVVWYRFHFLRCIKLEKKTINIGPCCIFD